MNTQLPITQFLADKAAGYRPTDGDSFTAYPIQFTARDGQVQTGYIQEVLTNFHKQQDAKSIEVHVLAEDHKTVYVFSKTCVVPKGCRINWDTINCIYQLIY